MSRTPCAIFRPSECCALAADAIKLQVKMQISMHDSLAIFVIWTDFVFVLFIVFSRFSGTNLHWFVAHDT